MLLMEFKAIIQCFTLNSYSKAVFVHCNRLLLSRNPYMELEITKISFLEAEICNFRNIWRPSWIYAN